MPMIQAWTSWEPMIAAIPVPIPMIPPVATKRLNAD